MTKKESRLFMAVRQAKYAEQGQRITHHRSGFQEVFANADSGAGWLPGRTEDPDSWREDITEVKNYLASAITKVGDGDKGLSDALAQVLATVEALHRVPNGSLVERAKINKGSTQPMRHVPSNNISRRGEPQPEGGQAMPASALENKPDLLETKIQQLNARMLKKIHA